MRGLKKAFCLLFACLFILAGCDNAPDTFLAYNGDLYDFQSASRWHLIDEEAAWETIEVGFTDNNEVDETIQYTAKAKTLKNDPDRRIIAYGTAETNYYIKRGALPAVCASDVEKVVLAKDVSGVTVTLEQDGLRLWLDFLTQFYSDNTACTSEKWGKTVPDSYIYVYFSDFPAYYYYGYLGFSESGKLGFAPLDDEECNMRCFLLPEVLSNHILQLGY